MERLEDELYHEQEKFKAITEELDQTFAEMSGYQYVWKFCCLENMGIRAFLPVEFNCGCQR